jgi:UDP-2-acetamido-2,6-beta-L-arabino-hexul-4-ose reductase
LKVVITGANGFVGRNLRQRLAERGDVSVECFGRENRPEELPAVIAGADVVYHLAGVNRPLDPEDFARGNTGLTIAVCRALAAVAASQGKVPKVVFASSIQAERDNPYGRSKRDAEDVLLQASRDCGFLLRIFRLPNVFGKWARPNYNSVVATFCHAADAPLSLVHVDDVVDRFLHLLDGDTGTDPYAVIAPRYESTVGEVASLVREFHASRRSLVTERVGQGFIRALYATYVSYLPVDRFVYEVPKYGDSRGVFVEMLKTRDSGQFSFFTAHPGVTRGGHYHHSKTEKFLVIRGDARFRFRHVQTGESHELQTSGANPVIVETIPGWTHDITNVGADELIVMLWANEIFDRSRPDTIACPI